MNYLSVTQLRNNISQLAMLLEQGEKIKLLHRSRVIGEIIPADQSLVFDSQTFLSHYSGLKLQPLSSQTKKQLYLKHLQQKYGSSH